jgi:4-hydroxy-tetrahydrodipicolinate synthase
MTGSLFPRKFTTISKPWRDDGDAMACRAERLRNWDLLHHAYSATNPLPIKSLMRAIGLPAGLLRKPLRGFEGEALQKVLDILRHLELDRKYGYRLDGAQTAAE